MIIKSAFKKSVDFFSRDPARSYTLHGALIGEKHAPTSPYIEFLAMPLNRGGRATERLVTLGGTAMAAFALASAPVTFPAVATAIGYAAISKVAGIFTGAFVDDGLRRTAKKLKP